MFKQLRNKFLIVNLVIISLMMLVSFTFIYLITYKDIRHDITSEISKMSKMVNTDKDKDDLDSELDEPTLLGKNQSSDHPDTFILIVDNKNHLTKYISSLNLNRNFYKTALKEALEHKTNSGKFRTNSVYWEFLKKPCSNKVNYSITFLDVTSKYNYLTSLIYSFLVVALVMFIVIFFISRFFANKSIEPIIKAFEKQKQFTADASHELKTPLSVINTNIEVLLANGEDTINSQSKWIYYIKSEIARMTKLTNNLLYLAQTDNSDLKLISSNFNLSETAQNVILTMEASIFENNKVLNYDISPNIICCGNKEQISQVIMLLLDNALKYTNPNGNIDVLLKKNGNKAILSISNTGKGIPKENLKNIFDRFYRVDKSRSQKSGGYGLGLAIAKAIIYSHKGKIYVQSVENETTTFTIELPRV
ncbi:MAG: HAMP domain-containing sensor histidine kinase [Clostridium sp.]|nr:HAMP domain-containing sensor histidine kinase [Clostridium sp.]